MADAIQCDRCKKFQSHADIKDDEIWCGLWIKDPLFTADHRPAFHLCPMCWMAFGAFITNK